MPAAHPVKNYGGRLAYFEGIVARFAWRIRSRFAKVRTCSTRKHIPLLVSDVEVIAIQQVNEAYERLLKADVKYRFSIDMASLKSE